MNPAAPPSQTSPKTGPRVRVEFMPGRVAEVAAMQAHGTPKYVVCRLKAQANGTYAMIPETWNQMVRMTRELHAELGLPCSYQTIYKLVYAGFVRGCLLTHRTFLVDVASLAEHLKACEVQEGQEPFWNRARVERYRQACQRVRWADEDEEDGAKSKPSGESEKGRN